MALVKITRSFQVSIPKDVREALRLKEGDLIEVEAHEGQIVMIPKKLIDAAQAWFWTPEWQAGEREADEDIAKGRVTGPVRSSAEIRKHLGP